MSTAQTIEERLRPAHLTVPETTEGIMEAVEKLAAPDAKKASKTDRAKHAKGQERYHFELDYEDARGKRWQGKFTSKILSQAERQRMSIMRAMLGGNTPYDALDPETRTQNMIVAQLTFALVERPDWAKDLQGFVDHTVINAIYAEVASHEAYFFGWEDDPGQGRAGG